MPPENWKSFHRRRKMPILTIKQIKILIQETYTPKKANYVDTIQKPTQ